MMRKKLSERRGSGQMPSGLSRVGARLLEGAEEVAQWQARVAAEVAVRPRLAAAIVMSWAPTAATVRAVTATPTESSFSPVGTIRHFSFLVEGWQAGMREFWTAS